MSQLAHEVGAHLWFLYREETRSTTCTPHAWVASPSQGPPPSIKFAHDQLYLWVERDTHKSKGKQGWHSGESARLPPMWPRFEYRTQRHEWVEFVLVLFSALRVFLRVLQFSSLLKNQHTADSNWL